MLLFSRVANIVQSAKRIQSLEEKDRKIEEHKRIYRECSAAHDFGHFRLRPPPALLAKKKNENNDPRNAKMSTAIMQAGALGWDYKAYDWSSSPNEVADMPLKVSPMDKYLLFFFFIATISKIGFLCVRLIALAIR